MLSDLVAECYYVLVGDKKSSDIGNSSVVWSELVDIILRNNSVVGNYLKSVIVSNGDIIDESELTGLNNGNYKELKVCINIILNPFKKLTNWDYETAKRIYYRMMINIIYNKWLSGELVVTSLNKYCEQYNIPIYGITNGYNPFDVRRKKYGMPSGEIFEMVDRVYWTRNKMYNINKIIKACQKLL